MGRERQGGRHTRSETVLAAEAGGAFALSVIRVAFARVAAVERGEEAVEAGGAFGRAGGVGGTSSGRHYPE